MQQLFWSRSAPGHGFAALAAGPNPVRKKPIGSKNFRCSAPRFSCRLLHGYNAGRFKNIIAGRNCFVTAGEKSRCFIELALYRYFPLRWR